MQLMTDREMRNDMDLLNELFDTAPVVLDQVSKRHVVLTRKRVAFWTGFSVQNISDYCTGKYNIPIDFWRRFLEHVRDLRVVALLLGDSGNWELQFPDGDGVLATHVELFRQAVTAEGEYHEQMKYVAEILADGRVNELDATRVSAFSNAYYQHRATNAHLHQAVLMRFERAQARRACS